MTPEEEIKELKSIIQEQGKMLNRAIRALTHKPIADIDAIVEGLLKGLTPLIDRVLWRSVEIRSNALDLIVVELQKIIDAFWHISRDYCVRLTEKQLHQSLEDYERMLKKRKRKFYRGYPGVKRDLL